MFLMKDNKITPARVKVSQSPSYTLADLKRLGREYGNECQVQEDSMIEGLVMSHFVRWLAEKEKQTNERHL